MHKKPLSSRFPHTLQLASELGKPITFLALEACGADDPQAHGAISEFAAIVIGPFEFPFAVDSYVNPERTLSHDDLLRTGHSAKALAAHPAWPELWQEGLGNAVGESLVIGSGNVESLLAVINGQAQRYGLPAPRWDWVNLLDLYGLAAGRDFKGNLPVMAEELGVAAPGIARRVVAEPILLARLFEATLATFGASAVAAARHLQPATPGDPFALTPPPSRARPELRLVEPGPAPAGDPFDMDAYEGDTVPAMAPFYGGAFTLQELVDAMLDRLVAEGMVRNYADVIGALRGLGLVIEKSRDPYQGVVVETAIRAKRRLKGRYYRPNFAVASPGEAAPATPAPAAPESERPDMLTRLEEQIRADGYHSLEHQLRRVEPDSPQMTLQSVAYAVSMLLDRGRLDHELVADESILSWLTETVRPLARPGATGAILLKPIMTRLLDHPSLTEHQRKRLDYVQLRVALHRLGVSYPAKKKVG